MRSVVDALLATVASSAVRKAIDLLGQSAAKLLGLAPMRHPTRRRLPTALRIAHVAGLISAVWSSREKKYDSNCTP